ncbi:MAG TPA: urease accessory UreF family protein [Patescibacteria group bacterium]|nr:urease accessory UreF family protein [Patescibacteria group bacterium]
MLNLSPSENAFPLSADLTALRLLQLADSALPIGSLAHSFGIESLVAEGILTTGGLAVFFRGYIEEAGMVDAVFCREGWRLGSSSGKFTGGRWREINDFLSALKPARETRAASASLGENFLRAVLACADFPLLGEALGAGTGLDRKSKAIHHSPAFGLACGVLGIGEDSATLAYLHQSIAGLVSACQRLMPLGQRGAMRLVWDLKPAMIQTAERSRACGIDEVFCFMPLLDWGSMEHPALSPRLFIC